MTSQCVNIWFKQSKCALNIDSNGHQKKQKEQKTQKRFKTTKNQHKNVFFTSLVKIISKMAYSL